MLLVTVVGSLGESTSRGIMAEIDIDWAFWQRLFNTVLALSAVWISYRIYSRAKAREIPVFELSMIRRDNSDVSMDARLEIRNQSHITLRLRGIRLRKAFPFFWQTPNGIGLSTVSLIESGDLEPNYELGSNLDIPPGASKNFDFLIFLYPTGRKKESVRIIVYYYSLMGKIRTARYSMARNLKLPSK